MHPTSSLLLLLFLTISGAPPGAASSDSIYNTLQYYGFPPGLVPKDVVSRYDLNPSSGQFTIYLNTTCNFSAYHYDVQFKTQISGNIRMEEIENIHGVQVRIMNSYWADLMSVEMTEDDDEIEFSAGYTAAEFPAYYFYSIPECGCGFDCGEPTAALPELIH